MQQDRKFKLPPPPLRGFSHINRYWDPVHKKFAAKILPGEFYVTRDDEIIVTVLGSCISACVRDPKTGVGGMNHFMLPSGEDPIPGESPAQTMRAFSRYGTFAMERLIDAILGNGGERNNLEIKIFGGGRILNMSIDVGLQNINFIKNYVQTEGLKLLAEDVGDIFPRKVYYLPAIGKVRVLRLRKLPNNTVLDREETYRQEIESRQLVGKIEMFN